MKVYTFVIGLLDNGKPNIFTSVSDFKLDNWELIDVRELHFNIDNDEIIELAKKAQFAIDSMESVSNE